MVANQHHAPTIGGGRYTRHKVTARIRVPQRGPRLWGGKRSGLVGTVSKKNQKKVRIFRAENPSIN